MRWELATLGQHLAADVTTNAGLIGAAVVAVVGAGIAAMVTYLVARRTSSGRIGTSDAATLWAESQAMRAELRGEVVSLRAEIFSMSKEIHELKEEIRELRRRLRDTQGSDGS